MRSDAITKLALLTPQSCSTYISEGIGNTSENFGWFVYAHIYISYLLLLFFAYPRIFACAYANDTVRMPISLKFFVWFFESVYNYFVFVSSGTLHTRDRADLVGPADVRSFFGFFLSGQKSTFAVGKPGCTNFIHSFIFYLEHIACGFFVCAHFSIHAFVLVSSLIIFLLWCFCLWRVQNLFVVFIFFVFIAWR